MAAPGGAAEEEEIDYDALSFTDPRYWAHFYDEEDLDFYEWYSAEDWLPVAVEAVAARVRRACNDASLAVLDVGVGTSPLLFALASRASDPSAWSALHGVDFAPAAVEFMAARAARPDAPHPALRFWVADARTLDGVPDASVDLLLDKGCLDCFVTGDGGAADVAAYLAAAARVLRAPHGRAMLLAVNGADVPRLLATGDVVPDPHAGGGAARRAWGAAKEAAHAASGGGAWEQRLWVEETVAYAEKHVLVCAPQAPPEDQPPPLRCHECGRRHVSPAFAPADAPPPRDKCACGNRLRRFALS